MTPTAYRSSQKFLHWTIFLLIVGLFVLAHVPGFLHLPKGNPTRGAIIGIHISFGLVLLVLVAMRVVGRFVYGAPDLPANTPPLEALLAKVAHLALYALMIVIPLLGVYMVWLHGVGLNFFGLFTIPAPIAGNEVLHDQIKEVHEFFANLILFLLAVHVVAAAWHHYIKKDDVLTKMLPKRGA